MKNAYLSAWPVNNTQYMVANIIIIIKPQGQSITGTGQINHLAQSSKLLFPWGVACHGILSLVVSQAVILSMAISGCWRLFIKSADDIQMGSTQSKLDDGIWVQINFYGLEMDRGQVDKMRHGQGKGSIQGEALEKSAWEKFTRQRQGF